MTLYFRRRKGMCLENQLERIATALERIADQQLTLPLVPVKEKKGKKSQVENVEPEKEVSVSKVEESEGQEKAITQEQENQINQEEKSCQKEESIQETSKVSILPSDVSRSDLIKECERLNVIFDKKRATVLIFKALQETPGSKYYTGEKGEGKIETLDVEEAVEDITTPQEPVKEAVVDYPIDEVRKEMVSYAQKHGAEKAIAFIRQVNEKKSKLPELNQVELNKVMSLLKGE